MRPAVELLAGIPSVVYGFFGLVMLRPIIAELTGGRRASAPLTAWIILAIMIVPTIAALSEDALRSIPMGIREASYAMGATQWQTIYKVVVPAAKIGIIDAIILGMGRAIGETMAVLMVVGNAPQFFPTGICAAALDAHQPDRHGHALRRRALTAPRCSAWRRSCSSSRWRSSLASGSCRG